MIHLSAGKRTPKRSTLCTSQFRQSGFISFRRVVDWRNCVEPHAPQRLPLRGGGPHTVRRWRNLHEKYLQI